MTGVKHKFVREFLWFYGLAVMKREEYGSFWSPNLTWTASYQNKQSKAATLLFTFGIVLLEFVHDAYKNTAKLLISFVFPSQTGLLHVGWVVIESFALLQFHEGKMNVS